MAEGATRTRRVLLVGSSLTYYNGGIDAIVLQFWRAECLCRGTPIDRETDTVGRGTFSRPFLAVAR
jgi:hypothetical protein